MATSTIKRGNIVIGTISFEDGASALGTEVVASAAFPPPDGESETDQYESYESALRFLNFCYETHCEAAGITPEPKAPETPEVDEEAAYYAREAAQEEEEAAHHAAVDEREERIDRQRVLAQQDVLSEDECAELRELFEYFDAEAQAEEAAVEPPPTVRDDGSDDDLPF